MWTFVSLLHVMYLQMSHLGSGVRKGLITEVTVIWFLPAVHQLMSLQVTRRGEELATGIAGIACFSRVAFAV